MLRGPGKDRCPQVTCEDGHGAGVVVAAARAEPASGATPSRCGGSVAPRWRAPTAAVRAIPGGRDRGGQRAPPHIGARPAGAPPHRLSPPMSRRLGPRRWRDGIPGRRNVPPDTTPPRRQGLRIRPTSSRSRSVKDTSGLRRHALAICPPGLVKLTRQATGRACSATAAWTVRASRDCAQPLG